MIASPGNSYVSWIAKWPIMQIVLIFISIMAVVAFVRLWKRSVRELYHNRYGNAGAKRDAS